MSKKTLSEKPLIGFIGQGWIGKNYADNYEERGYKVVRYALEKPYNSNKDKIKNCDIVLIAVPTPTTPDGFNDSILRKVVKLVGKGNIAVIKSTIVPGTTEAIQKENPGIFVMHSPEFLSEATATDDAKNPARNIIGIPVSDTKYNEKAQKVLDTFPKAPYSTICLAKEAELIKYSANCFKFTKVVFFNLIYDLCHALGIDYSVIRDAMANDPMIADWHLDPIHKSGRGAGGGCFIKDFAAFREVYEGLVNDESGIELLKMFEKKNLELLKSSNKDKNLVEGVYGKM